MTTTTGGKRKPATSAGGEAMPVSTGFRFPDDAPRQLSTIDAWRQFGHELARTVQALEEDEWIVLGVKGRHRFVQVMDQGAAGIRVETVSDFYLGDGERLSDADAARLLAMGWHAPTRLPDAFGHDPDGSPNYFLDLAHPVPMWDLMALLINTLVDVHGAQHPNALEYTTGPSDALRFPNLGIRKSRA